MSYERVILLLGSDLGDRQMHLTTALDLIGKEIGEIIKLGEVTVTQPVDFTSDTEFLNQIICVVTALSPVNLLSKIKKIERQMGRVYITPRPGENYTSRIIDIDILQYASVSYISQTLTLPHPQITSRKFVAEMMGEFLQD